jgi:hypothetical protein
MFRTEIIAEISREKMKRSDPVYLIGSCFAAHIGHLLRMYKFDLTLNPFGVIYNPHSIFRLIVNSMAGIPIEEKGLIESQGTYRHFDFHSDISAVSREAFDSLYDRATKSTRKQIGQAGWIIVSMGTSLVFEHEKYGAIVANCHKLPAREFTQRLLTPEEIIHSFDSFYTQLRRVNKNAKVILTVSPVRHVKSTLEKNSVSKAILRYAAYSISANYDHVQYFPSFEIMMDDLRDYRFYLPDMVHPSEVAVDYIWQKFMDTYFDSETKDFIREWTQILKALAHRPFFPESTAHQRFIRETIRKLKTFEPQIDISEELVTLESQLL